MRERAEEELRDYEPQSSWQQDVIGGDGRRSGGDGRKSGGDGRRSRHLAQSRRSRPSEDAAMDIPPEEAVQDGLKRVHLTPELHRKAKVRPQ